METTVAVTVGHASFTLLETKYRDIADENKGKLTRYIFDNSLKHIGLIIAFSQS